MSIGDWELPAAQAPVQWAGPKTVEMEIHGLKFWIYQRNIFFAKNVFLQKNLSGIKILNLPEEYFFLRKRVTPKNIF